MPDKLNAKEAIYGFMGWLTSKKETLKIGSNCDCSVIPPLIEEFAKENDLDEVTDEWPTHLIHPKGKVAKGSPV